MEITYIYMYIYKLYIYTYIYKLLESLEKKADSRKKSTL